MVRTILYAKMYSILLYIINITDIVEIRENGELILIYLEPSLLIHFYSI